MTPNTTFQDEEKLRLILETRGRIHDCKDSKCTVDPNGNPITPLNPGSQKPKASKQLKDLFKKVRGQSWPVKPAPVHP